MSASFVYDSGALIALDDPRNRRALLDHRARLARSDNVIVPAVVAAQVVRDPARQARLMNVLRACDLVPFDRRHYLPVGRLLAQSGTSDVVDALVALTAARVPGSAVVTSDADDIRRLLDVLRAEVPLVEP